MRKTKIICTIGPATSDEKMLRRLAEAGMDVARLNMSHGDHASHKRVIDTIKAIRKDCGRRIAILMDIEGPKIRVRTFKNGGAPLAQGARFVLSAADCEGDSSKVAVTYPRLAEAVKAGTRILLDDGEIELTVESTSGSDVICRVVIGGLLKDNKSLNLPGIDIDIEYVNDKDRADILFGIENDVDYVAASFCRTAADILDVRSILNAHGGEAILVVAKIENRKGVDSIDGILEASDGIMVARGDMGVELDLVEVPRLQKLLIRETLAAGKTVITATQMLDSMIDNPRPTRAEVTDVAGAVYEGTSAIMLSGETAVGKYPVESVAMMDRIAVYTEADIDYRQRFSLLPPDSQASVAGAVAHAACLAAHSEDARAILAVTKSGATARMVAKYRPAVPVVACSPDDKTCNQLAMVWGVCTLLTDEADNSDALFAQVLKRAQEEEIVCPGDAVVLVAGVPLGKTGTTNTLKVQVI